MPRQISTALWSGAKYMTVSLNRERQAHQSHKLHSHPPTMQSQSKGKAQ